MSLTLKARENLHSAAAKRNFNLEHFTESAPRYDIATRMLSFGRDGAWKNLLVSSLPEIERPYCLDLACGTGDIAFRLSTKYTDAEILGIDLTQAMIEIAESKKNRSSTVFRVGDMNELDVESESIDIITGGYALRNTPDLKIALAEFHRVMKPNAIAAFLDFSKPSNPIAQKLQGIALKTWGSFCGLVLHGNPEVHGYIAASLAQFPDRETLHREFQLAGFQIENRTPLYGGMLEITQVRKSSV